MSDETGSNLRTYGIDVDPSRPNREVVTSITGVYVSADSGESWKRLSDLPDGEYRSVHFNSDGTVVVSGIPGTFLVKPFAEACVPRLRVREKPPVHNWSSREARELTRVGAGRGSNPQHIENIWFGWVTLISWAIDHFREADLSGLIGLDEWLGDSA
jgi:hypothetical protein